MMLNKAKQRLFNDSDVLNVSKAYTEANTERTSLDLPQGNDISEFDFTNMPRDEIENYRKERD